MHTNRFFRAAAASLGAGLVVQLTKMAADLGGYVEPAWLPDATHLVIVGGLGFVVLGLLVPADVDPKFRRGPAPRAYFTFGLGLLLRALGAPFAEVVGVAAAIVMAGQMLEVAAIGMMLLGRPAKAP